MSDQLLCFPLPLMPANGFSWKSTWKLCLSPTFLHEVHQQCIVVDCEINLFKSRCAFVLARRNFIMARPDGNTQFQCLKFEIHHNAFTRGEIEPEIVIVELPGHVPGLCPKTVLPDISKSGRAQCNASSTRKYSCSIPNVGVTLSTSRLKN